MDGHVGRAHEEGVEGVREPVGQELERRLRRAVLEHVSVPRRRAFPTLVHVGEPGRQDTLPATVAERAPDHALCADMVAALLHRHRDDPAPPLVWISRSGELTLQDLDAVWLSGARSAAAEAGLPLTFVVVTRRGWWDPRSGVSRTWVRLRAR